MRLQLTGAPEDRIIRMNDSNEPERTGPRLRLRVSGYRSFRDVDVDLGAFHVLVGPNGSGKSTLFDALAMVGDIITSSSLESALGSAMKRDFDRRVQRSRMGDAHGLTWMRKGGRITLAVDVPIPRTTGGSLGHGASTCRYEVEIDVSDSPRFVNETFSVNDSQGARDHSGIASQAPPLIEAEKDPTIEPTPAECERGPWRKIVERSGKGLEQVSYQSETSAGRYRFLIRPERSAFGSLPANERQFPVATWFRNRFRRDPMGPSSSGRYGQLRVLESFRPMMADLADGVHRLQTGDRPRHGDWVEHVRRAVPEIVDITTREHSEGQGRYLVVRRKNDLDVPSWLVSDGTMRVLALTLIAYSGDRYATYLIEEPEHAIHPYAIETVFQSLSSVCDAQVLLTTHSPLVARLAKPSQLLCFSKDEEGATRIVPASEHPSIKDWLDSVDFDAMHASGIFG